MPRQHAVFLALLLGVIACTCVPISVLNGLATPTPFSVVPTPGTPAPTVGGTDSADGADIDAILQRLDGTPCPDSDFTCVTLSVPLDHFDPSNQATRQVVFGVLPATGERRGMLVTAVGGPGASGLAVADAYSSYLEPSILEHFDLVFFDQRGVGMSGGLLCTDALTVYYNAEFDTTTPQGEAAAVEQAHTFAGSCIAEMGIPADELRFYSTSQAAEDLEIFRAATGDAQFWLYGESYGTQLAQTYAAAHPDRLSGLILDGVVDLTLTPEQFYAEQARAFHDVLIMTLEACNADGVCAKDIGGNAVEAWDDIAAELRASPQTFSFPLPSRQMETRQFTYGDLESAAAGYLYSEAQRMIFLRALASAQRGDLVPMARILYEYVSLDPETLAFVPDPTFFDPAYYTVECADYSMFPGDTPEARAEAYLRAGDAIEASQPYFSWVFYGEFPCLFWPTQADPARPPALAAEGIPTLVLGSTADPATPVSQAEAVASRLASASLIITEGGPHVTYGWGNSCPDDLVNAFLLDGEMPQPDERCQGEVTEPYEALSPPDAGQFNDPLDAFLYFDIDLYYLPEYYFWGGEPMTLGCPHGGTLTLTLLPNDRGEAWDIDACTFTPGFEMTGTAGYDYDTGRLAVEVDVTGHADGHLVYTRVNDPYSLSVRGTYGGQDIDITE